MKKTPIPVVLVELKRHAPFTAVGAATGLILMMALIAGGYLDRVAAISPRIFFVLHPLHVFLSALVTTGIFRLHGLRSKGLQIFLVGYIGAIGIATISDCIIPFLSESILGLPDRGLHIGVVEKPLATNIAALIGILTAGVRPATVFPHFGHVLISTWASLFHILMAAGSTLSIGKVMVIVLFLFVAVWLPCCLSDIVFPMLFVPDENRTE